MCSTRSSLPLERTTEFECLHHAAVDPVSGSQVCDSISSLELISMQQGTRPLLCETTSDSIPRFAAYSAVATISCQQTPIPLQGILPTTGYNSSIEKQVTIGIASPFFHSIIPMESRCICGHLSLGYVVSCQFTNTSTLIRYSTGDVYPGCSREGQEEPCARVYGQNPNLNLQSTTRGKVQV